MVYLSVGKFVATLAVIFLVFIAYRALTGGDGGDGGCETTLCCPDCEVISVTRVIDGDTFVSGGDRVRLFGMDTPEVGEPCYSEATARLRELAKDAVRVERRGQERETHSTGCCSTPTPSPARA